MKMTLFWHTFSHQLLDSTKKETFFEERDEDLLCMIVDVVGLQQTIRWMARPGFLHNRVKPIKD
jgi:hypothetical protein